MLNPFGVPEGDRGLSDRITETCRKVETILSIVVIGGEGEDMLRGYIPTRSEFG